MPAKPDSSKACQEDLHRMVVNPLNERSSLMLS